MISGNQLLFMKKELGKQITKKSKSENLYFRWPSRENSLAYKDKKQM